MGKNKQATLISFYAPTMTNPNDTKDKFYQELDSLIISVPKGNKLVILRDINAIVGADYQPWNGVIGKIGVGKCNSNGNELRTCSEHDLVITNTTTDHI